MPGVRLLRSAVSVAVMPDDALRFADRLLALLDATRYPATYKLATLLAIVDVTSERAGPGGQAPEVISAKEVASRLIELYWPQTVPYGAAAARSEPRVLSQAPQNDIPAKLAAWRAARGIDSAASVDDGRAADPKSWVGLEADLKMRAASRYSSRAARSRQVVISPMPKLAPAQKCSRK